MYEYDATHVYTTLDEAQDYFATPGQDQRHRGEGRRRRERRPAHAAVVTAAVARPDLRVRDWREINKNLFSALKLERIATFIILSIAIIVASFCIVCTLLLMVTEKAQGDRHPQGARRDRRRDPPHLHDRGRSSSAASARVFGVVDGRRPVHRASRGSGCGSIRTSITSIVCPST